MSNAVARIPFITVEEYLEGEKLASIRHEYVNGRVYPMAGPDAMSGASVRHNEIAGEAYSLLKSHLRGGACRTYLLDLKVRVQDADGGSFFYYPDVFVACDADQAESHVIEHPKLVIEVLSPSTWRHDCGEKAANYRLIPSIEEIVLIAQDWPEITIFRRSEGWKPNVFSRMDVMVRFQSLGFECPLGAFYESAPLPPDSRRPWYLGERGDA